MNRRASRTFHDYINMQSALQKCGTLLCNPATRFAIYIAIYSSSTTTHTLGR